MTNFDFLTAAPQFNTFSSVAVSDERILHIVFTPLYLRLTKKFRA